MKIKKYAAAIIIGGAMLSGAAFAAGNSATQTVPVTMDFDTPLSITKTSDINFGVLQAKTAGQYIIDTAGNVTASGGGVVLSSANKSAGVYSIAGSTLQTMNLAYALGTAVTGITLSAPVCIYGTTTYTGCTGATLAAPGAGTPLLVGVTASTDNSVAGVLTPSFTLTVMYN